MTEGPSRQGEKDQTGRNKLSIIDQPEEPIHIKSMVQESEKVEKFSLLRSQSVPIGPRSEGRLRCHSVSNLQPPETYKSK